MFNLLNRVTLNYLIVSVMFALPLVFLYFFGVEGFMKSAPFGDDFSVFYRAGASLIQGRDPWLELIDSGTPFSYPPHSLSIVALYAGLDFEIALFIHTLINFASIFVIAYFFNFYVLKLTRLNQLTFATLLPMMLLIGNPYMATSIHQGQLTLPAIAAVLLSWHFLKHGKIAFSAVFLCLATIKPTLAIVYVLWLLLERQFLLVFLGGMLSALLMVHAAIVLGPLTLFTSWFESMSGYSEVSINAPGAPYVVGLESVFAAHGIKGTGIIFSPMVLVALGLLYWKRHLFDEVQIVSLFYVIGFTFFYAHDYDYVAVVMVFSYLLYLGLSSNSYLSLISAGLIIFWFFLPQRILRDIDIALLHHTRTFVLPLSCFLVFIWSNRNTTKKVGNEFS